MGDLYIYLHTEKQKFMQFICGNLLLIVTILAFILLGYGSKYFFYAAQFDTIDMLQNYEWVLKWWISIGRFSLVAMKAIFENGFLNINFSNVMTLFMFPLAIIVWIGILFLKDKNLSKKKELLKNFAFAITFPTIPIMAEQVSFSLQNWEVISGFVVIAISARIFLDSENNPILLIISSCLLAWCLGLYQVFLSIFILCVFTVWLLDENLNNNHKFMKEILDDCLNKIIRIIMCIIVALAIYYFVNFAVQLLFDIEKSSYLWNSVNWFKEPTIYCLKNIVYYIKTLVWSNNNYYCSYLYGIIMIVFLIGSFTKKNKIYNFLMRIIIVLSPFYFSILFGGTILMRVQITLAPAIAVESMVIIQDILSLKIKCKYVLSKFVFLLLLVFSIRNTQILNQAWHSEYVTFEYDIQTCYDIDKRIQELPDIRQLKQIIFVGRSDFKAKAPYRISYENIGSSIFQLDWAGDEGRSKRITALMQSIGLDYIHVSSDKFGEIFKKYKEGSNPFYPQEGSILVDENVIVVILEG